MALDFLGSWSKQRTWAHNGYEYTVGYSGGKWYCCCVLQNTDDALPFPDGSDYVEIGSGAERETGLWGTSFGWLFFDLPLAGENRRYVSYNSGYTWQEV